ncbi:MAG: PEGA domain-containing protein [Ignavibacteriales bacterium]|nr:PEGA domain-containing protein [Ignavibacteriales bacterium]
MKTAKRMATLLAIILSVPILQLSAQPVSGRSKSGGLISPSAKSAAAAPYLNGVMKVDSLWESIRVIRDDDKALIIVHSEVPNLIIESNRKIIKVDQKSSGYWEIWLPYGTHILKFDAVGFQRLEVPARAYARKRVYEMRISGIVKNQLSTSDKGTLILRSQPDSAIIQIDGLPDFKGTTPHEFRNYAAGLYRITLSRDKYETKETIVTIEKDKTVTESIRLTALFGYIEIDATQAGQVMLGAQRLEKGKPIEIPVGRHTFNFQFSGSVRRDTTVVVPAGEKVMLKITQ